MLERSNCETFVYLPIIFLLVLYIEHCILFQQKKNMHAFFFFFILKYVRNCKRKNIIIFNMHLIYYKIAYYQYAHAFTTQYRKTETQQFMVIFKYFVYFNIQKLHNVCIMKLFMRIDRICK